MEYKLLRPHKLFDSRGVPTMYDVDDTVQVKQRALAEQLIRQGIITPTTFGNKDKLLPMANMNSFTPKSRIGFFINTSKFYSGGRIHLYQFAWTLAKAGHEVWIITNNRPKWASDYPSLDNLHIVIERTGTLPADIDVAITDGKGVFGKEALRYRDKYKGCKLVGMNFETPNWVKEYAPGVAARMPDSGELYKKCDYLLCNSEESKKYLQEHIGKDIEIYILPPAVNDFAIDVKDVDNPYRDTETPYIVWSARSSEYKGLNTVISVVQSYKKKLNVIAIGDPVGLPHNDELHKWISFVSPISDAQKMLLMKGAKAVVAPSLFEGFGMVPSEALSNGTPVVVYDLPVLRENYGDKLIYAKWKDKDDFSKKLFEVLEDDKQIEIDSEDAIAEYGMAKMKERVKDLPYCATTPKVTANMICYYGPTVQEALASIYKHVDEIVIAHGPTELWKDCPPDNSLQLIKDFYDPQNKIKLEARPLWKDKLEMRRWCQENTTGNRLLIVDADEIYVGLENWIKNVNYGCPKWVHFWHDSEHMVSDTPTMTRWGTRVGKGNPHHHYRYSFWRNSFKWKNHCMAVDSNGLSLSSKGTTAAATQANPECLIYHLGHVLNKELMEAKHNFYITRDGNDAARRARLKAWHNWNGKTGDCGDGVITKVDWELPELVKQAFQKLEG